VEGNALASVERNQQKGGVRGVWKMLAVVGIGLGVVLGWQWRRIRQGDHRHDQMIGQVAREHGLPPALVKAVVWKESRFRAWARGGKGELGLMQVTEMAAQEWADRRRDGDFRHEHTLDAVTNLHAGCFYLAKVTRRYLGTDRPYAYALADYNAGRGNVLRWMEGEARTNSAAFLGAMTFPGTRDYVESILARAPEYERDFRGR
jgi:soluble lytic murein transglycosylase